MTHTKSMTGYGKSTTQTEIGLLTTEIKCLNGKINDLSLRLPQPLHAKENDLRTLLTTEILRGKASVTITIETNNNTNNTPLINTALATEYYHQATALAHSLGIKPSKNLLNTVLQMPHITHTATTEPTPELWQATKNCVQNALLNFNEFRTTEGSKLAEELQNYIQTILAFLDKIIAEDPQRITQIKEKLQKNLQENTTKILQIDQNRLEQELIFYIEKLDITEEKIRLQQHCTYFTHTLQNELHNGKKLGFIAQEINREINTIGSKANNAHIQQWVVEMKNELEKIKEQTLNLL
jgi:uncharacterized protein (TIGR00255 family)